MAPRGYIEAVEDFRRARRQAALEQALARLTGRSDHLLSYDEVRRQVGAYGKIERGLHEIPVDDIVGSVGRYGDFTRTFLPRSDSMQERWARVKTVATDMTGWPPIDVFRLGDVYFVNDGNHRVSVARQMGMETIPAYVTEVQTKVPLTPDVDPDTLICKARYTDFLAATGLGETRPDADLELTAPGGYRHLHEHIDVHRHYMGIELQREIPYDEAAAHWFDTVYRPVVEVIRERGLLQDFPDRTETDLYLWLAEHQAELEEVLGWRVQRDAAADDLAAAEGRRRKRVLARVGEKIREALTIGELEPGPPPGAWRAQRAADEEEHLFRDLMVAINGVESGWNALEQALVFAGREGSTLRGLHVIRETDVRETALSESVDDGEGADAAAIAALRDRFEWEIAQTNVPGKFVVERGRVTHVLCDRARWNDLVVMPLSHPPGQKALERLSSGIRHVLHFCPRPILAVPQSAAATPLERPFLAYNGSPRAQEALYVATYLAARWQLPLVVAHVAEAEGEGEDVLETARTYLEEHGVEAELVVKQEPVAAALLSAVDQYDCDVIVIGGYGARPVVEMVMDSALNDVLRTSHKPILICR